MDESNKKPKDDKKKISVWQIILLIILIALVVVGSIFIAKQYKVKNEEKELAYTDLIEDINSDKIEKIKMTTGSNSITVTFKGEEEEKDRQKNVLVPNLQAFIELVQEKVDKEGLKIELTQVAVNPALKIMDTIFSMLPTILLVALIIMMFKMQGLGDSGKVYGGEENKKTDVRFDDIAGLDEEKNELIEIVDFLKKPKAYLDMGAKIPKGILLYGKPGTGKTLIAKAIAGEAGVPFISMSGSEFIEMFAGLGASRVRKLFEKAKKMAPCIIFIDEIDAIGSRRTSNSGAETENNQTLNQLLVEMDGFDSNETIIVLAATNRPEMLDKALLRPGRFDRQVTVNLPDVKGREEILKVHARNKVLADGVNIEALAKRTPGYSGADLENLLNEAALLAVRRNKEAITMSEIDEASDRVLMGPAKSSKTRSENDRKLVAYHESGHAVVGIKLKGANDVQKVTIIPRGSAGGYNMMIPSEEKICSTKTDLLEQITGLLAGRVAEEVVFGEVTTGAENDFSKATKIARAMVTEYGMSDLGPMQLEQQEGSVFLGRDYNKSRNFSNEVAHEIDTEMRKIIDECYKKATKIIKDNRDLLELLATTLLEYETLTKEQIDYLVENGKMPSEEEETTYEKMSLTKLKEIAKEKGIKGYTKMDKEEIIKELEK